MPNQKPAMFKMLTYIIGEQGVTASRIPANAVPYDTCNLDMFALLKQSVRLVDFDFAMNADASTQADAVFDLYHQALFSDEFTIYPVLKYNPNPKWVTVVERVGN